MSAELTPIVHEVTQPNVLGTLGLNWKLFLAQLVNVGIIILVLRTWVFKPLAKLLEERKKKIEDGLKHATEADKRLVDAKEKEDTLVAAARGEARKIVEESRSLGEKERTERVELAKRDIDLQVADAQIKIQTERLQALEAVRKEVAGLVMLATRKVSAVDADEKTQRTAIEQAMKELEQTKS